MEMNGMDSKLRTNVETKSVDSPDFAYEDGLQPQKGSTHNDVLDMSRMGKRQELQRNFRFLSIVGFIMILQSSWESTLL
ncbi:MAG: hypothetical protein Q9208_004655 [Pyrenodesmia sp. 3 TL-2023]